MTEILIKVHVDYLRDWLRDNSLSDLHPRIRNALYRINDLESSHPEEEIINIPVDQDINADELDLPARVGSPNTARLVGTRTRHCVKDVANILDDADIPFTIDPVGCVD